MNWIKKHSKWVILGSTFVIIIIIAIIDYKNIYVALTLIPSVLLSLLQSNNEKQEKFYEMQIAEKEKQQKEKEEEERFRKMLEFTFKTLLKNYKQAPLTAIEQQIANITIDKDFQITYLISNIHRYIGNGFSIATPIDNNDMYNNFYNNLKNIDNNGEQYIDILKRELPKILTPDVFDGEKLIIKDE